LTRGFTQLTLRIKGEKMRIGFVEIDNFRGIKRLRWAPEAGLNCLIGPGDSCKTTILDAAELVLSPRHSIGFDDLDFFDGNHNLPAVITVTLIDLPAEFITDAAYGHYLRGFVTTTKSVVAEPPLPEIGVPALSLRLTIDESLEGSWGIYNERVAAGDVKERSLSYTHRLEIAPVRLGSYAARDLSWGRNSVLTRMSEGAAGTNDILARAGRLARGHFKREAAALFTDSLNNIAVAAGKVGMSLPNKLSVGLDVENLSITKGSIAIHGGEVPLRAMGTGSSRLLVAALQDHAKASSCLTIIDEVEHGLEPYRIVRLLKHLKSEQRQSPQVFVTTHSPVVLRELKVDDLHVVRRSADGSVAVRAANKQHTNVDPQAPLRSMPEAYLAPTVLIGEGKTEVGLLRGLEDFWVTNGAASFAVKGVAVADGGGIDRAPALAAHFYKLGYRVGLLLDSDREPADQDVLPRLMRQDVSVFRWHGDYATEDMLFRQLPAGGVVELFDYTLTIVEPDAVLAAANKLRAPGDRIASIDDLRARLDEREVTEALLDRSKGKKGRDEELHHAWYKDIDKADYIGRMIVGPHLGGCHASLQEVVAGIRTWVDAGT
jgi:putative ATP-dependent endonuclease of OLD family